LKIEARRHKLKSASGYVSKNGGMLTYKNVVLRHCHSRHFWLTFLQAFFNCSCGRLFKRRAFI